MPDVTDAGARETLGMLKFTAATREGAAAEGTSQSIMDSRATAGADPGG